MTTVVSQGAALEWIEKEYGGKCKISQSVVSVPTLTPTLVTQNNADRVALVMVNLGTVDTFVTPNIGTVVAGNGVDLGANGGEVSVNVRDDMVLPIFEWRALTTSGTGTIYVLEVIREIRTGSVLA